MEIEKFLRRGLVICILLLFAGVSLLLPSTGAVSQKVSSVKGL